MYSVEKKDGDAQTVDPPCAAYVMESLHNLKHENIISSFVLFSFFAVSCSCVELIICEQMNKYKVRLKDISSLEFAENKAKCRLTLIRRSMVSSTHVTASTNPNIYNESPVNLPD